MPRGKRDPMDLARAAAALWAEDSPEIGYSARLLTQTNLPYRDPGDIPAWGRRNGNVHLIVQAGTEPTKEGKYRSIGYPYGTMPRLLMAWICREAVQTQQKDLVLGSSLTGFMNDLGLRPTGGKNGSITRLREQMKRLLKAKLSVHVDGNANRDTAAEIVVASGYDLWWSDDDECQRPLLPSTIRLSTDFFNEIVDHPVPLNMGALAALRGSALRLDIYTWLTYRMSYLSQPTVIPWESLRVQFGSNLATDRKGLHSFKKDFSEHLAQVRVVYQEARVEPTAAGLQLFPSPPHIKFRGTQQLYRAAKALPAARQSPSKAS
jgi:hypothetical protein